VDGRLVVDGRLAEDGRLVVVLDFRLAGAARLEVEVLRVVHFLAGMVWRLRLTACYTCLNIFFMELGSIVLDENISGNFLNQICFVYGQPWHTT